MSASSSFAQTLDRVVGHSLNKPTYIVSLSKQPTATFATYTVHVYLITTNTSFELSFSNMEMRKLLYDDRQSSHADNDVRKIALSKAEQSSLEMRDALAEGIEWINAKRQSAFRTWKRRQRRRRTNKKKTDAEKKCIGDLDVEITSAAKPCLPPPRSCLVRHTKDRNKAQERKVVTIATNDVEVREKDMPLASTRQEPQMTKTVSAQEPDFSSPTLFLDLDGVLVPHSGMGIPGARQEYERLFGDRDKLYLKKPNRSEADDLAEHVRKCTVYTMFMDAHATICLEQWLRDHPEVIVIVSSNWRNYDWNRATLTTIFGPRYPYLASRMVGCTETFATEEDRKRLWYLGKSQAILRHVLKYQPCTWAGVDDAQMLKEIEHNMVRVNSEKLLTPEDLNAVNWLMWEKDKITTNV